MVTLPCPACGAALPEEARFCGSCGSRVPDEDPADVARYAEAVAALGHRVEAWAVEELAALRGELRIRAATHERLVKPAAAAVPLELDVDSVTLDEFRVGERCVVRLRVRNGGRRALAITLSATSSTSREVQQVAAAGVTGPGESAFLQLVVSPERAGHHSLRLELTATGFGAGAAVFHADELPFKVGAAAPLHQSIHIDARSQKVGIFENIGAAPRGGLLAEARWRPIPVSAGPAPRAATEPGEGVVLPAVGVRGAGVVVSGGEAPVIALGEVHGVLVELEDPALRGVLGPGDRLDVTVLGHDGRGGLLLSTRAPRSVAPAVVSEGRVGPGESLAAALAAAPAGARIAVSGVHQGPFRVERRLELTGDGTLEAARGPVLTIAADVVVRGLVVRGAAPPSGYAADAIEIRAGRVLLDGCTVSSDAPQNLTPGRAVAVTGPATVEIRGGQLQDSGIGVAVDVSWSGFATDGAAGARVHVSGTRFTRVNTGAAAAGAGRVLTLERCDLLGVVDRAVHVHRGASVTVLECRVHRDRLTAEPQSTLTARDNTP